MIKVIASDVDGTLIRKGMLHVDPRLFDIIRELKKHNILFVAASGRPYNNLIEVFEPVKDEIAYISESGPIGMYHNEMFYDKPLDREIVVSMVNDIRSREGGNILFSQVESTYLETTPGSPYHNYMAHELLYNSLIVPDVLALGKPCYKVASCNLAGNEADSIYYKEKYGDDYTVVTSGDYWVDMIPKGVDKGTCLQALLTKLGVAPDECMAFGDQENDMAMLELAGTSYAMNTSMPHVVEAAGHATNCPEDVMEAFLKTLK
jgi:hypothetical protein